MNEPWDVEAWILQCAKMTHKRWPLKKKYRCYAPDIKAQAAPKGKK